jgi:hypothetical protein
MIFKSGELPALDGTPLAALPVCSYRFVNLQMMEIKFHAHGYCASKLAIKDNP